MSTVTDKKRQQGKQRNINETVKLQTKHTRQRNKPNTRTHMKMRAHPQTRTQRAHMNQSQRRRPNYYKHTNTGYIVGSQSQTADLSSRSVMSYLTRMISPWHLKNLLNDLRSAVVLKP